MTPREIEAAVASIDERCNDSQLLEAICRYRPEATTRGKKILLAGLVACARDRGLRVAGVEGWQHEKA